MVSVLDVLGQPVLGPVDLLTVNWNLEIIQDNPELVVLHLVINTVVAWNRAESLLLVIKVFSHGVLHCCQFLSVIRCLGYSKDLGKQNIVFLIQAGVLQYRI